MSILLVDDEPAVLRILELILARGGFQILATTSPVEALSIFESDADSIQLLITDMQMPEMHGTHLASRIRQMRPEVAVLYLSGFTKEFPRGGSDPFLSKPISADRLVAEARRLTQEPRPKANSEEGAGKRATAPTYVRYN